MTWQRRRPKQARFLVGFPRGHRYCVTGTALARAMFLARVHDGPLTTGLAELTIPAHTSRIETPPTHARQPSTT